MSPGFQALGKPLQGTGLGLRRALIGPLSELDASPVDFYEIAPENWMRVGGRLGKSLRRLTESHTFSCHGLSLSLGGPSPLDESFLADLKNFLDQHNIHTYSEHLSYCSDDGHLYDLLPMPFTQEAVRHVASRIRRVQEVLERPVSIENISYYAAPGKQMEEIQFLLAVLKEADCGLLLDVNNVYVNSVNHAYDASDFIAQLPADRITSIHIAGHYVESAELLIDTHGAPVINPVWRLLEQAYSVSGVKPTLLERDFNIPPLPELLAELDEIRRLQLACLPPAWDYGRKTA